MIIPVGPFVILCQWFLCDAVEIYLPSVAELDAAERLENC